MPRYSDDQWNFQRLRITFFIQPGHGKNLPVTNANGHVELNTNSNLNIQVKAAKGKLDINQCHAVSKICFSEEQKYYLKNAGRFTRFVNSDSKILIGKRNTEDPSEPTDLIVELNGWKSETQILNTKEEKQNESDSE